MNQTQTIDKTYEQTRQPVSAAHKVAFIQACWHKEIVDQCYNAFVDELELLSEGTAGIERFEVPGAFEIPLRAKLLAKSGHYDAIVASAFVVDGGIYRHDFVASAVIDGLMSVQLETEVPVFSAVLTPLRFHGHDEHQKFFEDHFIVKGREAAQACMNVLKASRDQIALASRPI